MAVALTQSQSAGCQDRRRQREPMNCDLTECQPNWRADCEKKEKRGRERGKEGGREGGREGEREGGREARQCQCRSMTDRPGAILPPSATHCVHTPV